MVCETQLRPRWEIAPLVEEDLVLWRLVENRLDLWPQGSHRESPLICSDEVDLVRQVAQRRLLDLPLGENEPESDRERNADEDDDAASPGRHTLPLQILPAGHSSSVVQVVRQTSWTHCWPALHCNPPQSEGALWWQPAAVHSSATTQMLLDATVMPGMVADVGNGTKSLTVLRARRRQARPDPAAIAGVTT
jgi:hypothetical protein